MLKNCTIFFRVSCLILLGLAGSLVQSAYTLLEMHGTLLDNKKEILVEIVDVANGIATYYHGMAAKGLMSQADAQRSARDAIRDLRYGSNDYFFVYGYDGTCLVLGPKPQKEGENLLAVTDANGVRFVAELVDAAKRGAGFVEYAFPKAGSTDALPKLGYAVGFEPWGWMIGSGIYIDDVDAAFRAELIQSGGIAAGIFLALIGAGLMIGRSITGPLKRLTAATSRLAAGDTDVAIEERGGTDEISSLTRAVLVFKQNAIAKQRLEQEQEALKLQAELDRRQTLTTLADDFEGTVQGVIKSLADSAQQMLGTSQGMVTTADQTSRQATVVASATHETSANVQTVAAATQQMTSSVAEIARQMGESTRISAVVAEEAEQTQTKVRELAEAAKQIGTIINLINAIADQTNLLALNATIEAARAGDAGKGFAVVAGEVKVLAAQTASATDEIRQQIDNVRSGIGGSVQAIEGITRTIARMTEIAATVAAAVEQQDAATQEIARNIEQASRGTTEVSSNITGVSDATALTGEAAVQVREVALRVVDQSETIENRLRQFIADIRASATGSLASA